MERRVRCGVARAWLAGTRVSCAGGASAVLYRAGAQRAARVPSPESGKGQRPVTRERAHGPHGTRHA